MLIEQLEKIADAIGLDQSNDSAYEQLRGVIDSLEYVGATKGKNTSKWTHQYNFRADEESESDV
jgi:hypothetical protein